LKKLILFIFFPLNFLFALEVKCNFEEVYQNSEVQQGIFLIKNKMLRYQYFDKDLFTIISKNNNFYLINNSSKTVHKINEKTKYIETLIKIISDFPHINDVYNSTEMNIKIEKSQNEFIKRVSVHSEELNLSINIMNCKFKEIKKVYFRHFNFEEYKD
tara:strand:+ start:3274 stop:3747 length:474 start_codon:yes stop_codon:yes gene_type:complete